MWHSISEIKDSFGSAVYAFMRVLDETVPDLTSYSRIGVHLLARIRIQSMGSA